MTAKESVKELIEKLPDDSKYEDIIAEIYFKQQVEEGLAELDKGHGIPHEEVKKHFNLHLTHEHARGLY